jgi:hypothetical protein
LSITAGLIATLAHGLVGYAMTAAETHAREAERHEQSRSALKARSAAREQAASEVTIWQQAVIGLVQQQAVCQQAAVIAAFNAIARQRGEIVCRGMAPGEVKTGCRVLSLSEAKAAELKARADNRQVSRDLADARVKLKAADARLSHTDQLLMTTLRETLVVARVKPSAYANGDVGTATTAADESLNALANAERQLQEQALAISSKSKISRNLTAVVVSLSVIAAVIVFIRRRRDSSQG